MNAAIALLNLLFTFDFAEIAEIVYALDRFLPMLSIWQFVLLYQKLTPFKIFYYNNAYGGGLVYAAIVWSGNLLVLLVDFFSFFFFSFSCISRVIHLQLLKYFNSLVFGNLQMMPFFPYLSDVEVEVVEVRL